MATKTTNYNLTKPDLNDYADIRVLNNNMDIIDSAMKSISDLAGTGSGGASVDLSAYALKSQLDNYLPLSGGNITGELTINDVPVATKTEIKEGTKKGEEQDSWKTYLPDGRVMFKMTIGQKQSIATLPVVMANTQYTVIQCDNTIELNRVGNVAGDYIAYVVSRGISEKTTNSFKMWSVVEVGNVEYKYAYWNDKYFGKCDVIIIGWEA